MRLLILLLFAALGACCCTLLGCGSPTADPTRNLARDQDPKAHDPDGHLHDDQAHSDHGHGDHGHGDHGHGEHPVHGPHDGELIELGNEAYHAEWIVDEESGTVTLFVLDGTARQEVPIEAKTLSIEVTLDGQRQQHLVSALREPGAERTAQFQASNRALVSLLKLAGKGTEASLALEIDGQTYTGRFVAHQHAHDHAH